MKKKRKPTVWIPKKVDDLRKHANDPWPELKKRFGLSASQLFKVMSEHNIHRSRQRSFVWDDETDKIVIAAAMESSKYNRYDSPDELRNLMDNIIQKLKKSGFKGNANKNSIFLHLRDIEQERIQALGFKDVKAPLSWGGKKSKENKDVEKDTAEKVEIPKEQVLETLALEIRPRNDPPVFTPNAKLWKESSIRVGLLSATGYPGDTFRAGAIYAAFEKLRDECARFNILIGLSDKHAIRQKVLESVQAKKDALIEEKDRAVKCREKIANITVAELREQVEEETVEDVASALSSFIPKTRIPNSDKYVRLYIQTSPAYDGYLAERIALRLHELRPEDIRVCSENHMHWVKDVEEYICGVVPVKNRLPSQYYSTVIEREIRDARKQKSRLPFLWAVGPFSSDVYTPDKGTHREAYTSIPGMRDIKRVHTAENQIGVVVLDFKDKNLLPLRRSWSMRDMIENEWMSIMPPRNATELQKKIVKVVQERRGETIGVISDFLPEYTRKEIQNAIDGLVEKEPSKLKSWPGLHRDESDRYYFHLSWVQERLRYNWPAEFKEDRTLFFGCSHFGYTTTDYQHIVEEYPRIILQHGITHLFGIGDFVAGMKHDLPHSGECIAGMNYTDFERFAGEGFATIIFRVFEKRFDTELESRTGRKKITPEELIQMLHRSLIYFPFIPGNHDMWVLKDGHTPLSVFHERVLELLRHHIGKVLLKHSLPFIDLGAILNQHIIHFEDVEAVYKLPSGLNVGMLHPYEGRSKTTTLKLQGMFEAEETCHIWGIANYHTATTMREWSGRLGERIGIMAGAAGPVYTFFERRKRKRFNDFGPIMLRVLSHNKKIIMHEIGYFNRPILKERISKHTDPDKLKKSLGLLA